MTLKACSTAVRCDRHTIFSGYVHYLYYILGTLDTNSNGMWCTGMIGIIRRTILLQNIWIGFHDVLFGKGVVELSDGTFKFLGRRIIHSLGFSTRRTSGWFYWLMFLRTIETSGCSQPYGWADYNFPVVSARWLCNRSRRESDGMTWAKKLKSGWYEGLLEVKCVWSAGCKYAHECSRTTLWSRHYAYPAQHSTTPSLGPGYGIKTPSHHVSLHSISWTRKYYPCITCIITVWHSFTTWANLCSRCSTSFKRGQEGTRIREIIRDLLESEKNYTTYSLQNIRPLTSFEVNCSK